MKQPDKSNIKGVIFDLGSTLIEYENIPWDEMDMLAFEAGYRYLEKNVNPIPSLEQLKTEYLQVRDYWRSYSAKTLEETSIVKRLAGLFEKVGIDNTDKTAARFFSHGYEVILKQLSMFDDTIPLLDKLKKAGKKIGLVSNTIFPEDYHINDLSGFGILEYFDFLIFSSSFGYRKPHRSIYEKAVELSGLDKDQLVFVGDRYPEDYLGPRENGIFSVLKYRQGREYPAPLPENIVMVKSLTELLPILLNKFDDLP